MAGARRAARTGRVRGRAARALPRRRPGAGRLKLALLIGLSATLVACGSATPTRTTTSTRTTTDTRTATDTRPSDRLPADYVPVPAGRTPPYRLPAVSRAVARRTAIDGLTCGRPGAARYGVHLELYAERLVLPVPAGIGIAPPQRRRGAYVRSGACVYPIRTYEPTGLVVIDRRDRVPAPRLGTLFAIWGQPLSRTRLAGFHGRVAAFVGGVRWAGAPESIPLTRHAEIVLEIGTSVPPHRTYLFPPGL